MQTLGKYTLHQELGRGAYAVVWRAEDSRLGRTVALKVLKTGWLEDEMAQARFEREASIGANLYHPHIAVVHEVGEAEGRPYIAMRYVEGQPLDHMLKERGALPWAEALAIVEQVASALDYAHGRGLVHRDVKPANIVVSPTEGAVLTDFGLARAIDLAQSVGLTGSAGQVGTPYYRPPELWLGERKAGSPTAATDVYSLACVLVEMVTGKVLFAGDSVSEIITAHLTEAPALPEAWPPEVPQGVEGALRQALAKKMAERTASAGEFVVGLREAGKVKGKVEIGAQAEVLEGLPLSRTDGGLVMATPASIAELLALPDPPERIWWERAEMELCLVPAGEFLMGIGEKEARKWHKEYGGELKWYTDATPQHWVALQAFYIGVTPVTQAQYARFVRQADHPAPFGDDDWAMPYNWNQERKTFPQGKADHPVVLVSWHDAVAFCRWTGLRLPTEAEWEKAASWGPGTGQKRVYPWGNQWDSRKCNSAERIAGRELPAHSDWKKWADNWLELDAVTRNQDTTTPVGTYNPAGDSPYGCADMAGNVGQWISSLYAPYPYHAEDGREGPDAEGARVIRGGSWTYSQYWARSATRYRLVPDYSFIHYGFRCCVS